MNARYENGHRLHPCATPGCGRPTTSDHCCTPCWSAHDGRYEIHEVGPLAHSEGCEERTARRVEQGHPEGQKAKK